MTETIPGTEATQIPQQRGMSLLETAVRYAEERHWDVFPGTWLEATDGVQRCSCEDTACAAPGAHPAREDWATQATGSATVARRMWQKQPTASILLPTGRTFDAIDVPESAGFLALARMERMELTLGPVTLAPDRRMRFFVLPGPPPRCRNWCGSWAGRPGCSTSPRSGRARTWRRRPPGTGRGVPCSGLAGRRRPTGGCPMWRS